MELDLPAFKRARCEAAYNGRYADVVFVVGSDSDSGPPVRRFPVTRALFAMASDTFQAMLYQPDSDLEFRAALAEVRIPDLSPEAFDRLSRHVHELDPEFTECNVLEVLRAADKYQMPQLTHDCKAFIRKVTQEGIERSIKLLKTAGDLQSQYGPHPDDVAHVVAYLREKVATYGPQCLKHDLAPDLSVDDVRGILASQQFISTEEAIWSDLVVWAQLRSEQDGAACIWQELVQKVTDMVRFNDMQPEFFVEHVIASGVLTKDEIINIQSHWLHPRAVRAVLGCVAPRQGVLCIGISRQGEALSVRNHDGKWTSGAFFHARRQENIEIEIVLKCDVPHGSLDKRFMVGFVPLHRGRNGHSLRLEEGADFGASLDLRAMLAPHTSSFGDHLFPLNLPDGGDKLVVGMRLAMRYKLKPMPTLSFQVNDLRKSRVPSTYVPPADWAPCLLLYGTDMSVDVVRGLPSEVRLDMN